MREEYIQGSIRRIDILSLWCSKRGAMRIFAIDPGPEKSAFVELDCGKLNVWGIEPNDSFRLRCIAAAGKPRCDVAVIEKVASYGMAVGQTVFETVFWSGRFAEICEERGIPVVRIPRLDVKLQICRDSRAKDANIRQALIDRYGGPSAIKKGGPLYKVSKDVWAALAVGITYWETRRLRGVA